MSLMNRFSPNQNSEVLNKIHPIVPVNTNRQPLPRKGLILDISVFINNIKDTIANLGLNVVDENGYDLGIAELLNITDFILATATRVMADDKFILTDEYWINNIRIINMSKNYNLVKEINGLLNYFVNNIILNDMSYYALYIDNIVNDSVYITGYSLEVHHSR